MFDGQKANDHANADLEERVDVKLLSPGSDAHQTSIQAEGYC